MSLPEDLDFVDAQGRASLRELGGELARGRVVLFAGAGLSMNALRKDGGRERLPGWWALVEKLRNGLEADLAQEQDALRIADYFRAARGRNALVSAVMGAIPDADYVPGPIHNRVVELSFREIITTNFDTLLERAFEAAHIVPQVVVEGRDLTRTRQPPRIIKMNGCLTRNPDDIVISGDDFLAYGERHRLMQVFITRCFVESRVLFVGFSLDDPAFRAIQDWVRQRLGDDVPMAWSLHLSTSATQRDYWRQRGVDLIDLSGAPSALGPSDKISAVLDTLLTLQRQGEPPPPGQIARRPLADHGVGKGGPDLKALRSIARLDGWRAGGLTLDRAAWQPVAATVDALLSGDPTPEEAVLCADLALRLSTVLALPPPSPDGHDLLAAPQCTRRLIRSVKALSQLAPAAVDGLEPALRSRALLLICLLGSVAQCREIVGLWTASGDGALTADLDRLTLLSFHGLLSTRPGLIQGAAEQLRLTGQPGEGGPRATEASMRYLHLIRAVGGEVWSWPVSHLYRARLERVAGQMLLERTARPSRGPVRAVLAVLKAMARGALFIGPPPEELDDLWAAVQGADVEGGDPLPWLPLIIVSLPFEGEALIWRHGRQLSAAWRRGDLDAVALIELAALRLADGGFRDLPDRTASDSPAKDRGAGRYACGLAYLLRWLVDRIDEEALEGDGLLLRQRFLQVLGEPLIEWLIQTPYAEIRSHLQYLWAVAGRWPEAPRDALLQRWIDHHLRGGSARQSMGLALIDPPRPGVTVDRDQVRILLALAQAGRHRGTSFRHDLQGWLIGHAEAGVLDEGTLELLARHLTECLIADADGPGFHWLKLASRIRRSDVLTGGLSAHLGGAGHPRSLVDFITQRFEALDDAGWARWGFSRPSFLSSLVPFARAGELTGALWRAAGDLSPTKDLSKDGVEGTVALLAALIEAGEAAHVEALGGWIELGATGRGALGPVVERLDPAQRQALQTQLLLILDHEGRRRPQEIIGWITDTLAGAPDGLLPDLEAGLTAAIFSRHPAVAMAALGALHGLLSDPQRGPGLIARHGDTLGRILPVIRRRAQHRPSSRFVSWLGALHDQLQRDTA